MRFNLLFIMTLIISNGSSTAKSFKLIFAFTGFFAFGFLVGSGYKGTINKFRLIFPPVTQSDKKSSLNKQDAVKSDFPGYNSTHLWSMRLADDNYFRLARLLPCRTVEYTGGPENGKIDSCDHSSANEYSRSNILQAQKWLYEHQHPANCTNQRFAIIHNFAWSGFGSTVHQIAWAFGKAIADNRIAVYQTPGNWVRERKV